jgi:hypothetical protein
LAIFSGDQAFGQKFGRAANDPFSGRITVIDKLQPSSTTTANKGNTTPASERPKSDVLSKIGVSTRPKSSATAADAGTLPAKPRVVLRKAPSIDLGPVIAKAWQEARPKLIKNGEEYLKEHDIGGGFRTSRNHLNLAENGELFSGWDGNGFTVRYVLRGNSLATRLRTPTPVDRDADPAFDVKFDAEVTIDVDIKSNSLTSRPARLKLNVGRPTGKNITGDLAVAANDLVKCLSGDDFIGQKLAGINGRDFALTPPVNIALAKLNPTLDRAAKKVTVIPGFDNKSRGITLTLVNASKEPVIH